MILLLNKMVRSFIILFLASFVIIYLVLISTNEVFFENKTDLSLMLQTIIDYYKGMIFEQSLGETRHRVPVIDAIPTYFTKSLKIIIPSFLICIFVGITLGIIHYITRERRVNNFLFKFNNLIFGTVPDFFLFIAVQFGLLLLFRAGFEQLDLYGDEYWYNLILPITIMCITPTFYISNITYHSLLNEKDKDYVTTAYSKGTSQLVVTLKHLLWNSWPTILSYTQTVMLIIVSSLPIIEKLAFYRGAGSELLISIKANDTYTILGLVLPFLLLVLISMWVTDIVKLFIIPSAIDQELSDQTISKANRFKNIKRIYFFLKGFPYRKTGRKLLAFVKEHPSFSIGLFILGSLFFIAILGPLMPFVDKKLEGFRFIYGDNGRLIIAPLSPNGEYWFGTDRDGRDLLSMIVIGARETLTELVVIVVLRFMISIPLGYFASVHKGSRALLGLSNSILSFLPTIILVMLIANIPTLQESYARHATLLIVIALLDIGRIGEIMRQEFIKINKNDYLLAAVSVGTHWYDIITRYYIPNIYQKLIYIFVSDMARIMVLLGGLGIVQVYLSQALIFDGETGQTHIENLSLTWPSLLSNSILDIRTAPWIPFFPSLFIAITVIGLNLFGTGLKDFLDKRKNRFEERGAETVDRSRWAWTDFKKDMSV